MSKEPIRNAQDTVWDRMKAQMNGCNAQVLGKPITANPHPESTTNDLRHFWSFGWKLSKREGK